MSGEIALDTSTAVRFLNGDVTIIERVLVLPEVILPMIVVGDLIQADFRYPSQPSPYQGESKRQCEWDIFYL
ncbi:hypothetical protein [Iningainema tapete]|uniref:hypothetical protein n=1 Tax=Iningainema tapete TaxID=2806730 RepID=UPI00192D8535|nr:hypothetical protein [Iningainema tapete]